MENEQLTSNEFMDAVLTSGLPHHLYKVLFAYCHVGGWKSGVAAFLTDEDQRAFGIPDKTLCRHIPELVKLGWFIPNGKSRMGYNRYLIQVPPRASVAVDGQSDRCEQVTTEGHIVQLDGHSVPTEGHIVRPQQSEWPIEVIREEIIEGTAEETIMTPGDFFARELPTESESSSGVISTEPAGQVADAPRPSRSPDSYTEEVGQLNIPKGRSGGFRLVTITTLC